MGQVTTKPATDIAPDGHTAGTLAELVNALTTTALTRIELCARLGWDGPTFDRLAEQAMGAGLVAHNHWGLYFLPNR